MSRTAAFTGPCVKFSCVLQNDNYRAVAEATIRLREKTGRTVSLSVVLDALVETSDMDAIVEEIAKMTIQTDKARYSKHIVKAATKRVRFQGHELYLVAEKSFTETEMVLATTDVISAPELTFAAVVGHDVWRHGEIIGSRSEIEDI